MSGTLQSIIMYAIFIIIIFAAIALLVTPQFAQAIAIVVILIAIAGLAQRLSERN